MDAVVTALTTSLTGVGTAMTGTISSILPIALPLVGGILVVTFGLKIFKKVTGKA